MHTVAQGHAQKLIPTRKALHLVLTAIAMDTSAELLRVDGFDQLRKHNFSGIHPGISACGLRRNASKLSHRSHPSTSLAGL
jgi:hypothetical protein